MTLSKKASLEKQLSELEDLIRQLSEQFSNEVHSENATGRTTMRNSNATKYRLDTMYKERKKLELAILIASPSRYEKTAVKLLEKSQLLTETQKNIMYYKKSIEQMAATILRNYKDKDSQEQLLADLSAFKNSMKRESAKLIALEHEVKKLTEKLHNYEQRS